MVTAAPCKAYICAFGPRPHLQCSRSSVGERRFSTPGPRGFEPCREHGPVAQRMSAEILPRRTQVRFLSGSPIGASTGRGPARPAKPSVPAGMRVGISALRHPCGLGSLVDYRPSKATRRVRFSQPAPISLPSSSGQEGGPSFRPCAIRLYTPVSVKRLCSSGLEATCNPCVSACMHGNPH
jgi:hypothetical protein